MCGIAGFVGIGDRDSLARMIKTLAHRGPDDKGVWHEGLVGLAHARLSVIDLSPLGHQPMQSADGTVSIVFNGEIYNYQKLRNDLESRGSTFRSKSDTEVIIRMYEVFGEEAFARLDGMFALALYDSKNKSLLLARDRMGEKPLYFSVVHDTLVFASEIKALFEHPQVKRSINPRSVVSYLTYDAVLTPESMFEGIHKLEAATYAVYTKGKLEKHIYWKAPNYVDQSMRFGDALANLDSVLGKSVSGQTVADVPVGVFLSGGLDSSTIAYYAGLNRTEPLHTFSIGFDDPSYDESMYAREAAHTLHTIHHERIVNATDMLQSLHAITAKLDEPIADPAMLPTYLLSQFAREYVTVALGGEGSDELFSGYQTFVADHVAALYGRLPKVARTALKHTVSMLPVSHRYFSFDFKARQFLRGAESESRYMHQKWMESFSADEKKELLAPEYHALAAEHPYMRIDEYLDQMASNDENLQKSYVYLRTYLLDVLLAKVDRMSMLHSLEVRAPFLDKDVVELALGMPHAYKYRGMTGKYILRQLMKNRLPHPIVSRKKHGFGLPIGRWFQGEWRELLTDTLTAHRVRSAGFFSPEVIERLINEHVSGARNHRKKLWSLLMFQLWYDAWGKGTKNT